MLNVKPNYCENVRLCYIDTDCFLISIIFTKILQMMLKQKIDTSN